MKFAFQAARGLTLALTVLLLVSACSDGGRGRSIGSQCPRDYNPFPEDPGPAFQKIYFGPGDAQIPVGRYEYERSDLYYVEDEGKAEGTNFRIHVTEYRDEDKALKTQVNCVRNSAGKTSEVSAQAETVTMMAIPSAGHIFSATKTIGFSTDETRFVVKIENTNNKPSKPGDIYQGKAVNPFIFRHEDPNIYEIRAQGPSSNGRGTFYLSVKMRWTPCEAGCPIPLSFGNH